MSITNDETMFAAQHALRTFEALEEDAHERVAKAIESARRDLDEAQRRLDRDEMPNTCGILQTRATEVEMAIGALAAIRDAARPFKALADAFAAVTSR
ncbi:MAG: hypothetical protein KF724_12435 [Phycisphaeraceae bacterium]|nr:hypothetical protein [Phycisphaeraceae bacterium]